MEIRNYTIGDENKIVELFKLVFKQEMSLAQWKWRFELNPAGKHLIKLMWDEDVLVGHYAVSPLMMLINNKEVFTAHSLTTMTHPDYGGKGIFKTLSLELYELLENKLGCKSIWGFPNNNSHGAFVSSLGWTDIAVIHTLGRSAKGINEAHKNSLLTEFDFFEDLHADYITEKLEQFKVKIKKDRSYLNWRYQLKPAVRYKKFFSNDEVKMLFVTKIYPSGTEGLFDLNIVECYMDDYSLINQCINEIMLSYKLNFERITLWKNIFDADHIKLEKQGFFPVLPQTFLGARIHNSMPHDFSNIKNWNLAMGDSDVF